MTELDEHGQPPPGFLRNGNKEKTFKALIGILHGIAADSEINSEEIVWLSNWMKQARKYLSRDPDFIDLEDLVDDILSDGLITQEEREDIFSLVENIIACRSMGFANETEAARLLIGFLGGISADNAINEEEAILLRSWLDTTEPWINSPAIELLRENVMTLLNSKEIQSVELERIYQHVKNLTGRDIGCAARIGDDEALIEFTGNAFCFTGKFERYTRQQCFEITRTLGGNVHKTITKNTNYLVIGSLSSRDWVYTSFGRKIEKALHYKKETGLIITSEHNWHQHTLKFSR